MIRYDTRQSHALARYVIVVLASLFFLVFAYTRASSASSAAPAVLKADDIVKIYVTTVNLLNVREAPSAQATIVRVVSKGTRLTVRSETADGWLRLTDGTYAKSAYAKLVGQKSKAPVQALSYASYSESAADSSAGTSAGASGEPNPNPSFYVPFPAVKSDSGLSEENISRLFEGTKLLDNDLEEAILEIEQDYGINAFFTVAVMKLESGNGTSKAAANRNNLFGMRSGQGDGYLRFDTKADSVRRFGRLISENYIEEGYTSITKISGKYCPPNKDWASLVANIIKRDYGLLQGQTV